MNTAFLVGDRCVEPCVRLWGMVMVWINSSQVRNTTCSSNMDTSAAHAKARTGFNPCLFNGSIYLCDSSTILEAFSPQNGLMLSYQIDRPNTESNCCMYVENDLLVVHLNYNILKYRGGEMGLVQASRSSTQEMLCPKASGEYSPQSLLYC